MNPYGNTNFVVDIQDLDASIQFREVTGLDSGNYVMTYREGADPMNALRKLPGLEETKTVTLKRGMTNSLALWEWRKAVRDGSTARVPYRNVEITLRDGTLQPVMTWSLINAWCAKITGPQLNAAATTDAIAIEQMELSFDRIDLKIP
jgi:phage tail-like protein